MKSIIFWNKSQYATDISEALGDVDVITSELELIAPSKNCAIKHVIILAELTWNDRKLSDFSGFEILCQLRAEHRLRCPIAVCSFMPESWLRKKFPILEFPQHHPFIRLPASAETFIEKIQKAETADEPRLNDIISSYCDPKGRLIRLITHGKGFRQITRNVGVIQGDDSLWSTCSDDVGLLRKYLVNKLLGNTILSLGNELAANLEEAIRARNLQNLLATKPTFDALLNELAKGKGISIAH